MKSFRREAGPESEHGSTQKVYMDDSCSRPRWARPDAVLTLGSSETLHPEALNLEAQTLNPEP